MKRIFDARDIEIPFPHQTLYFGVGKDGKAPPMHMVREDEPADDTATAKPAKTLEAKPKRRRREDEIAGKDMPDVDEGPEDEN